MFVKRFAEIELDGVLTTGLNSLISHKWGSPFCFDISLKLKGASNQGCQLAFSGGFAPDV